MTLLNDVSGWLQLLTNEDKELNLQNRFIINLHHTLDQSNLNMHKLIILQFVLFYKIILVFFSNKKMLPSSKKLNFLQQILEFQKFAQQGLIAVNIFIFKYMLSWDGMEYAPIIYELFEYLSFTSEEGILIKYFIKLYTY